MLPFLLLIHALQTLQLHQNINFNAKLLTFTGVDEIFVEHVKRVFSADKFTVEQKPTQRLRCTTNGPRWEVDSLGKDVQ